MSHASPEPGKHAGPDNPPQQETPHDVPVYPEHDTPPPRELDAGAGSSKTDQPVHGEEPGEGQEDVDEDDLDPRVPHSPPDAGKGKGKDGILFDENKVAG